MVKCPKCDSDYVYGFYTEIDDDEVYHIWELVNGWDALPPEYYGGFHCENCGFEWEHDDDDE